jgi:endoglucanase
MNFGGALDGARGDDDGLLRERHYDAVREAGFDTVRLPVRWSAHLAECPPYAVDGAFFWERRGDRRRASTGPR